MVFNIHKFCEFLTARDAEGACHYVETEKNTKGNQVTHVDLKLILPSKTSEPREFWIKTFKTLHQVLIRNPHLISLSISPQNFADDEIRNAFIEALKGSSISEMIFSTGGSVHYHLGTHVAKIIKAYPVSQLFFHNAIAKNEFHTLKEALTHPKLNTLTIAGTTLTLKGLSEVSYAIKENASITSFCLKLPLNYHTQSGFKSVLNSIRALTALKDSKLETLRFSSNHLSAPESLQAIGATFPQTLTHLDLSDNNIRALEAIRVLGPMLRGKPLATLNLKGIDFSKPEALTEFAQALQGLPLTALDISGSWNLTLENVQALTCLVKNSTLKTLTLMQPHPRCYPDLRYLITSLLDTNLETLVLTCGVVDLVQLKQSGKELHPSMNSLLDGWVNPAIARIWNNLRSNSRATPVNNDDEKWLNFVLKESNAPALKIPIFESSIQSPLNLTDYFLKIILALDNTMVREITVQSYGLKRDDGRIFSPVIQALTKACSDIFQKIGQQGNIPPSETDEELKFWTACKKHLKFSLLIIEGLATPDILPLLEQCKNITDLKFPHKAPKSFSSCVVDIELQQVMNRMLQDNVKKEENKIIWTNAVSPENETGLQYLVMHALASLEEAHTSVKSPSGSNVAYNKWGYMVEPETGNNILPDHIEEGLACFRQQQRVPQPRITLKTKTDGGEEATAMEIDQRNTAATQAPDEAAPPVPSSVHWTDNVRSNDNAEDRLIVESWEPPEKRRRLNEERGNCNQGMFRL